jgi:hypothetical protein
MTHHAWPGAFAISLSIFFKYVAEVDAWWINLLLLMTTLYCTFFLLLEVTRKKEKSLDDCPRG